MTSLFNKVNYLNEYIDPFFISTFIKEYDMKKANISILKYKGVISDKEFDYYSNLPKLERQIKIGLLQRNNPEISTLLSNTMKEIKNRFIEENNLSIYNVISIKNDAFFVLQPFPFNTVIDDSIEFVNKNTYTSYYLFNKNFSVPKVECYYYLNRMSDEERLDIKGISDKKLPLHENYFMDLLKTVFYSAETEPIQETINLLTTIYESYIKREMDIEYYREFNNESKYRLNVNGLFFTGDYIDKEDIRYVNITNNLNILRQLIAFYAMSYYK